MTSLDQIVAMAGLSTRMVEAARANDWPLLAELEQQLAGLREALAASERGRQSEPSSPRDAERKAELIRQILADGEEVLRHVEPFQDSVRRFLSTTSMERSLRQAYAVRP
jgi:flagellar protein FliT